MIWNKLVRIGLFCAISCVTGGCVRVSEPSPLRENTAADDELAIRNRVDEIYATVKAGDAAKLESFHLKGAPYSKFDEAGHTGLMSYDAAMKGERAVLEKLNKFDYKIDTLRVDVFGSVGVAAFTYSYDAIFDGTALKEKAKATMVFVKIEGEWKIAHEHLSDL